MRLLHTEPLSNVRARLMKQAEAVYNISHAHTTMVKLAGKPTTTHALSGELYASKSGWLLLDVPNALVRGAFDALNEPGAELPEKNDSNGSHLTAHISVMRPEEIEQIGGIDKITERGHHFHYTLGPVQEVRPAGWKEMSKVWFIQVKSKELQDLRKSYGLSPRPNNSEFDFHITIAVRRKKVLQDNDIAKAAAVAADMTGWEIKDSPIDGKGLFARRPYKAGEMIEHHAMRKNQGHNSYDQSDVARFTNHSDDPNIALVPHKSGVAEVATKDIPAGTEMFGDYNTLLPLLGADLQFTYKGKPYYGESTSGRSSVNGPETKVAALVWPLLRSVVNVEGVKALLNPGHKEVPAEVDPAEEILADDSHMDNVRADPVVLPRRKRRPQPVAAELATPYLSKQGENYGLPQLPTERSQDFTSRTTGQPEEVRRGPASSNAAGTTDTRGTTATADDQAWSPGKVASVSSDMLSWRETHDQATCAAIAAYYTGDSSNSFAAAKSAGFDTRGTGRLTLGEIRQHLDDNNLVIIKDGEYHHVVYGYDGDTLLLSRGVKHEPSTTRKVAAAGADLWSQEWDGIALTQQPGGLLQREESKYAMDREQWIRLLHTSTGGDDLCTRSVSVITGLCPSTSGNGQGEGRQKAAAGEASGLAERRRRQALEKLKQIGLPVGGAGLAAALLHNSTNTLVPAQVTRFPGEAKAHVIRGPIYHGAPASVLEDTGGGYMVTSPRLHGDASIGGRWPDVPFARSHAVIDGPASLGSALRRQQRPGHPLEALEILGHGNYDHQNLGDGTGVNGSLNQQTVGNVANQINSAPLSPNATIFNYGCNGGLCTSPNPTHDWQQQLSNLTGANTMGSRGYTWTSNGTALNAGVLAETPPFSAVPASNQNAASESNAWTHYKPNQPRSVIHSLQDVAQYDAPLQPGQTKPDQLHHDKHTYGALSADKLHELMYNVGKPSAIVGALASPFIKDETKARNTALIASLLATPMAASESAIRMHEANADQDLHGTDSWKAHLLGQAKALPHVALAALPLLSYGGAKLLGRWDKEKPRR